MNLDEQIEFVACMAGWFPDDKLRQLSGSLRELKRLREGADLGAAYEVMRAAGAKLEESPDGQ